MNSTSNLVTLSFDNGPDPEVTPQVLRVLREHGVKTTFFVIGERLRDPARRAICEGAHAEGHWIGNHTYNHLTPLGLSQDPNIAQREIAAAQTLIGPLSRPEPLFRPGGSLGALNQSLLNQGAANYLQANHYTCVLWNAIPRDWDDPDGWVETALAQCEREPWPLLVLHDIQTGAMKRLDQFLSALRQRGKDIVQPFPPDCLPIVGGRVVRPIDAYVA
ncbi:MAG: polysaccharide deacetylase family protein [Candidimonas sp.]|nr:MAG: polysaccharide deacetylase family protein [Candidimonas sp.]